MTLTEAVNQFGFVALISFGLTYAVIVLYGRKTGKEISSFKRMSIQFVFAFILGFVPLDFQNIVLNHIRDAAGIVAGMTAVWQIVKAL